MATGLPGDDPDVRAAALKDLVAKRVAAAAAKAGPASLTAPKKGKAVSISSIQPRKSK